MPRPFRRAELAKSLGFNLADAFARDVELLPDFFQSMLPLTADSEAQPDDLLFFGREGFENIGGLVAHVRVDDGVHGRANPAIFDQIAEGGFAVAAYRGLQRYRIAGDGLQLLDLL